LYRLCISLMNLPLRLFVEIPVSCTIWVFTVCSGYEEASSLRNSALRIWWIFIATRYECMRTGHMCFCRKHKAPSFKWSGPCMLQSGECFEPFLKVLVPIDDTSSAAGHATELT
jgi:hypothetical protein